MRIFMPRYGMINERRNQLHEVIRLSGINMIINDNDHPLIIKVASIQQARMQIYFIDNEDFFKRKTMFKVDSKRPNDNDERSIFFVRGALEAIKKLRWIPDVIHCHGWFTALAMVYLKKFYHDDPVLKKAKVVYSLYKEEEHNLIPKDLFEKLRFDKITDEDFKMMDNTTDTNALIDWPSIMPMVLFKAVPTLIRDWKVISKNVASRCFRIKTKRCEPKHLIIFITPFLNEKQCIEIPVGFAGYMGHGKL